MTLRYFALAAAAALMLAGPPAVARADDATTMAQAPVKLGDLEIFGGFARATLPNAPVGGGYLSVTNTGKAADRLVSASSPAAGKVSLHEMSMDGSVMKMRDLPNGIEIPAGKTVTMAPSGLHMMFEHLKGAFVEGKTVPVTLTFEKAGTATVQLNVLGIAASGPMSGMAM